MNLALLETFLLVNSWISVTSVAICKDAITGDARSATGNPNFWQISSPYSNQGGDKFCQPFTTVKLGIKELFDKEQIGIRNHFLWPICHLLHKDKELLALRNNFRATKMFPIAKFDCTSEELEFKLEK